MKYLVIMTALSSLSVWAQECDFEGSKWRGQRTFTEACNSNRENLQCDLNVQTDEEIHKQLETCQCLMAKSEFISEHNELLQYRMGRTASGLDPDIPVYQRRAIVRDKIKELCHPFKAVEVHIQNSSTNDRLPDRKYYAIYEYNERQEECIPIHTKSNFAAIGEKFNFPGAYNFTAGFSNLFTLGALHLGYNGPLNVAYVNDEDARRGILNCSGTYSQMIELANAADRRNEERDEGGDRESSTDSDQRTHTGATPE